MTQPAPVHLNRYHHFTQLMRDPRVECGVSRYTSRVDQTRQSVLVLRPAPKREGGDLFVFLHGMDGDCGDAVVMRELVTELGGTVVAPGGRGPAWVADAFLADAARIIREQARDSQRVYLIGVSMGGTQALVLASGIAGVLAAKLAGVIAFIPGADLVDIAIHSANERVRRTLTSSVGDDLAMLRERSPLALVDKYRPGLPFVIAYNEADTILPVSSTLTLIERMSERGLPVVAHAIPGNHSFVADKLDERIDYRALVASLGAKSPKATPVPVHRISLAA